ncbi:short subunit dehydrogenase-like uncharacterized protein [Jatrophihabitans sp. GAS493]|uniref:saccharopine dehydrogenase family protein n=1 Tax=Jatrophihabitans sp. GAS493 TaxID=1907575 RepID=UPI000BB7616C|nr:saccharopine dehydrogenase NADP-binding domain-containing protein [Jatrophihabitans sp. GAS493]SOD75160.1 short subunit dehydrogenase-like uncharacterized protein [Jatrophihabitans sp. GAS493]
MTDDRSYDIVLYGATGFTGSLTAQYLARHAPVDCRWALAGRNRAKLESVRTLLTTIRPELADLPLIQADATDPESLTALTASTRVVISTVGPYINYGEPLVAACAAAGTDYVDLTGEPEFVDLMYLKYHERAVASGARLVHSCGFDSIPHDLGTFFTVAQLPEDVALTVSGVVSTNATFSAGTYHSALTGFAHARQTIRTARQRSSVEAAVGRHSGSTRRARSTTGRAHRVEGGWAVPLPTIDPQVIARSARALPRYGPEFQYSHYAKVKHLPVAIGAGLGLGLLIGLAQIPPVRKLLLSRATPGEGPSLERRDRSRFSVRFTGHGGGRTVVTLVSGGDPGYDETSKMLAESALCLAFDDLPKTSGQVTTATAMGQALLERLIAAGIGFEVVATEGR